MFYIFFVLFSINVLQASSKSEISEQPTKMGKVPHLKALAARAAYKKIKADHRKVVDIQNIPEEVRDLISLYEPLSITKVINCLIEARKIQDKDLQEQCLKFIHDHRAEICFEVRNPKTGKRFAHKKDSGMLTFISYRKGLRRLQNFINKDDLENPIRLELDEDESRTHFYQYSRHRQWVSGLPRTMYVVCSMMTCTFSITGFMCWLILRTTG